MLQPSDLNMAPPGNWKYTEPATGVKFSHHNLGAMIKQIKEHRAGNNLPTHGDWLERVYEQMCIQNPGLKCYDASFPDRIWTADDVWRFVMTMKETIAGGVTAVSEEEQVRRIDICSKCPKLGIIGCKHCGGMAQFLTEMTLGRKLPNLDSVYKRSCLSCGCDVTAKTAYPLDVLKSVDEKLGTKPDYDASCWMLES